MAIGNLPQLQPGDSDEIQVKKINEALRRIEQELSGVNNFRGTWKTLTVQNGVKVTIPGTVGYALVSSKIIANNGTVTAPTWSLQGVTGGWNLEVKWTGTATTCTVQVFIGD